MLFFFISIFVALSTGVWAAGLTQVSNFGSNPTDIQMYTYVPAKLASPPPVIVALHPCGGSAQEYYSLTKLPSYADQLGFILIYPSTTHFSNCWDCDSNATLIHNGNGDSNGIANMVSYVLKTYNADSSRVFAAGSSSGAMMTNVLAATYPDVFNAGASFSGVAAGCLYGSPESTPSSPDQTCAHGQKTYTAQQWGDIARGMYPGYTGRRTRMQIWSGTADQVVYYPTFGQQLAQWSNVLGVSFSHNVSNTPISGYTEEVYGDGTQLQGYSAAGVGHFVPFQEVSVLTFFGLLGGSTTTSSASRTATSTGSTTPTTTSSPGGCSQPKYGQCGGNGYTGCTTCASGSTCQASNSYYSQCL